MNCFVIKNWRTGSLVSAIAGFMILSAPQSAEAQVSLGNDLGKMIAEQIQKSMAAALKRQVNLSPAANTVTDSIKTITLELEHKNDEAVTAKLSLSNSPASWTAASTSTLPGAEAVKDSTKKKRSLVDEEENKKDTTSLAYKPMAEWIKGLPQTITIAPGEKKKITLTITVPSGVLPGEYAAWVVTEVQPDEKAAFRSPILASAKIAYKK